MRPPVALLVYNPKNLRQASFYPFAEFSPEWQAILFGLRHKIPVRFMDLPMNLTFALGADDETSGQMVLDLPDTTGYQQSAQGDPFTEIARLGGYTDPERWWEATFERHPVSPAGIAPGSGADEAFVLVLELMQALRDDKTRQGLVESRETLLREAFMRQTIRAAQKEGFKSVAVVCGAWHAPALADTPGIKAAHDAALLKGLKKIKTQSTWIPWSFDRLAAQSGYGAGVMAPAWYQTLWEAGSATGAPRAAFRAPHAVWFAQAVHLLRQNDLVLSSAHVIEAVRLSETLAALRHTLLPGIEELKEAAVTVLCEGAEKPYELIERHLVTGNALGQVPASVPVVPLKADFEAQVRSARLNLSTEEQILALDLREAAHLRKSQLLHRLGLLHIPWGKTEEITGRREGRFHENWTIKWLPDYEIRLIEAGAWGNTVEAAATRRTRRNIENTQQIQALVQLLGSVLKAELPGIFPPLLLKLRQATALSQDALLLAETVLPLVEVLRYGHARQMQLPAIEQLLEQIVPRVCIQLPGACQGVNEDVAAEVLKKILGLHRALGLWQRDEFDSIWQTALWHIAGGTVPLLAGLCARLLFEQNAWTAEDTATAMRYHLSRAQPAYEAAQWLEGFLHGSGLLLLHQPALWQILDEWVSGVPEGEFPGLLPLLRRAFSQYTGPEREKMLDLAKNGFSSAIDMDPVTGDWDPGRAAMVWPLLRQIL